MNIREDTDLKNYSSIQIGGLAKFFTEINDETDIPEIVKFSRDKKMELVILGQGSNTFFADGIIKKVFAIMKIKGIHISFRTSDLINIEVGAGEDWDNLVDWSLKEGLSGLENLSLIPGTVGASPVQNIGAYGQEVKNVITHVRAYDTEYDEFIEIPNDQCLFTYRNSIFKANPKRFIISTVSFQLKKVSDSTKLPIPQYKDLQVYFISRGQKTALPEEIRKAVIEIRTSKLPLPAELPNCGSYFKNPIIPGDFAKNLLERFPKMPQNILEDGTVKLFAGWLIENAELKGLEYKNLATHNKSALVVVNRAKENGGQTKATDLLEFEHIINEKIERMYGIVLEREPNYIK